MKNRLLHLVTEREREKGERFSQAELARALDISYNSLERWLENKVTRFDAPIVERMCDYFGVGVGELLYIDRSEKESA